jgi:DNA replication protein DnaD
MLLALCVAYSVVSALLLFKVKSLEVENEKLKTRVRSFSHPFELDLEAVDLAMDKMEIDDLINEIDRNWRKL